MAQQRGLFLFWRCSAWAVCIWSVSVYETCRVNDRSWILVPKWLLLQLWWASYCISSKWSSSEQCAFYRYLPLSVWGMSKRSLNLSVVGALCKAADIPSPSAQWTYWMEHHLLKSEVTYSHVFPLHFALSFLPFTGRSRRTDSPCPHL